MEDKKALNNEQKRNLENYSRELMARMYKITSQFYNWKEIHSDLQWCGVIHH